MLAGTGAHRPAVRVPRPRDLGIAGLARPRNDVDGLLLREGPGRASHGYRVATGMTRMPIFIGERI
jgi:hypothetical protein